MGQYDIQKYTSIFGIDIGLIFIVMFSSLKSKMNLTVSFFLSIIKLGATCSELVISFKTPILANQSIFICRTGF